MTINAFKDEPVIGYRTVQRDAKRVRILPFLRSGVDRRA